MKTQIKLKINGENHCLEIDPCSKLIDVLRTDAKLLSPKFGCGVGECGACTVVVDGSSVNSCLLVAGQAQGKHIETVESETPLMVDLQLSFSRNGAVQCGYCTPGMIHSAYALLLRNPQASREAIIEAIEGNLCRCTGYEYIIDAIEAVARAYPKRYLAPEAVKAAVGASCERKDALDKAQGTARYLPDMEVPGMLFARLKLSPHASAKILSIDTSKAEALEGVRAVLTGESYHEKLGLYMQDKDILARGCVRYQGEAVAAVAADTLAIATAAIELIDVSYAPAEVVHDVFEALKPGAKLLHPELMSYSRMTSSFYPQAGTNIAHWQKIRKGDVDLALETACHRFKHSFSNPIVAHVPMETHGAIVTAKRNGEVEIITSAQSPFTVRHLFAHTFGIPEAKIRVSVPYVGGGFGGKAGIGIEPLAYCLSKSAHYRPVRLVLTREEEFNMTPARQGLEATIETGVDAEGRILALKVEYLWDAGAYADYGVNVGRAAAYSGAGPYEIPNCCIDSKVVYTNKVFGTAYRGFGHLEVMWGIERNMDMIAAKIGLDPCEFRRRNLLHVGSTTITGEVFGPQHGRPDLCLAAVEKAIGWNEGVDGRKSMPVLKGKIRSKGIAMLQKAPAMPSSTSSAVVIQFSADGSITLQVSGIDYGQGSYSALAQLAAHELSIPYEAVRVPWESNTDFTPYDWQTVASRFTVMGGNATISACQDALRQIKEIAAQVLHAPVEKIAHGNGHVWVEGYPCRKIAFKDIVLGYVYPDGTAIGGPVIGRGRCIAQGLTTLDPETGQGNPALQWTFGAHAIEIELDLETGHIDVLEVVSAFDVGRVIHEQNCRGQVIGGVVQGLGSALLEQYIFDEAGTLKNASFVDYKVPTARDIPAKMSQIFIETPHPQGPYGARGVAEHPMISIPSVIGNAIANGTGVDICALPLTPERVFTELRRKS